MSWQTLANFGWPESKLSIEHLVILGHSFGAATVMGSSATCEDAKAVIAMDPWLFPYSKEVIRTG